MLPIVTDSRFYMWRTLFAVIHADNYVSEEEVHFMAEVLESVPFTPEQKAVLEQDAREPQDIETMYAGVTDYADQSEFFKFARQLVYVDGDYGPEEQAIITRLQKTHVHSADIDELIGTVELSFEEDAPPAPVSQEKGSKRLGVSALLRELFLKDKL